MAARIGVVVVHYQRWDLTERCVASVRAAHYQNVAIHVVDNDAVNRGFAGGANVGIRDALIDPKVEYVLVLNNDVWLEQQALPEMVHTAQVSGSDMIVPIVRAARDGGLDRVGIRLASTWLGYNKADNFCQEPLAPSGCAGLYSRRLLEAIASDGDYFDEDFFMYGEDTDVGLRARALGFRCVVAERAEIFHEGSASVPDPSFARYFGHRNNVWYIAKNISLSHWYQWPAIVMGQLSCLAWLTLRGDANVIWKAKYDAVKKLPVMWRKRHRYRIVTGTST